MAILKFKKLVEDLQNNTSQVLTTMAKAGAGAQSGTAAVATLAVKATSAAEAGTAGIAGTAAVATLATKATSAAEAGTAGIARTAGTAEGLTSIHGGAGTHAY